ncbi:Rgr1p [Sporobolomyces koalae]|uniref:Rgr1p n=1 Tax=Sporobolomyces koalae TaxID=500713 RepID=UPI00316ECD7D
MDLSLPPIPIAPTSTAPTTNGTTSAPSAVPATAQPPLSSKPSVHERELPTVATDLIPLSYLIDRLVTQSFSDLSTLLETLPSHSDQQRKQLLVDYVLHTRRQFLKLLVLTRWSAESDRIRKSMNIIGFLADQNHQLDETIHGLSHTVEGLRNARVRNYDLETSLQVLQQGTYPALPSAIREAFMAQESLADDQVIETMRECEQVMRWRLRMGMDRLPKLMTENYTIADGRVTFTIDRSWEASFVYSGTETSDGEPREATTGSADDEEELERKLAAQDQSEWYLLGIKFLFKVKDQNGRDWNPTPTGPLKQHLIDLGNAQLARRPFLPAPPPPPPPPNPSQQPFEGKDPTADLEAKHEESVQTYKTDLASARAKRKRDQPLERAYTFLQRLALSYRLESIYSQAVSLIQSDWNGCGLSVEMNGERDQVKVRYWNDTEESKPKPSANQKKPTTNTPLTGPGGTLIFSLNPIPAAPSPVHPARPSVPDFSGSTDHVDDRRKKALDHLLSSLTRNPTTTSDVSLNGVDSTARVPDATIPEKEPPPTCLYISHLSPEGVERSEPEPKLTQDETLENMLKMVTYRYSRSTVGSIARELEQAGFEGIKVMRTGRARGASMMQLDEDVNDQGEDEDRARDSEEEHVFVPLVGPHAISLHIDHKSGKFEIRACTNSEDVAAEENTAEQLGKGLGTGESGNREGRLRSASERINSSRFSGEGNGHAWLKSVPEVIAKIRATTILDEISILLTLLSLPSLRRLPLLPRELSKFGPLPYLTVGRPTFLFVPLNAHTKQQGLEGFYLSIVLIGEGIRMGLVGTKDCRDEGTGNTWVEITEVGWIYQGNEAGKDRVGSEDERGSDFGSWVTADVLRKVWTYCVHRILVYRLEQQLFSRQISYRCSVSSPTVTAPAIRSTRLSLDVDPPPYLIVDTHNLVRFSSVVSWKDKAHQGELVLRNAALRCEWDEETNVIRTILHVRFNPLLPSACLPAPFSTLVRSKSSTPAAKRDIGLPENIFYNPATRSVVLLTENDLLSSIERLLRAYAGMVQELVEGFERHRTESGKRILDQTAQ